jgi:hypothetical protein
MASNPRPQTPLGLIGDPPTALASRPEKLMGLMFWMWMFGWMLIAGIE